MVTRTFERAEGAEHLVRNVELAIAPFPGLHVDYSDGSGEGTVAHVWTKLRGLDAGRLSACRHDPDDQRAGRPSRRRQGGRLDRDATARRAAEGLNPCVIPISRPKTRLQAL
jgi:hypothetical protein